MNPFPEEAALRELFGADPALLEANSPWRDNALSFDVMRDADRVECLIEPVYGTLTLRWTREQRELVYLDLNRVRGLTADKFRGRDSLIAHFDDETGLKPLRIQLRPGVHVSWGTRDDAERAAGADGQAALNL